jgi:hypothetical protein
LRFASAQLFLHVVSSLHIHIERLRRPGDSDDVEVSGVVTTIEQTAPDRYVVKLSAATSETTNVHLTLPEGCTPPFAVGDALHVRQSTWIEGIHVINNACITTASGDLLAALASNGDPDFAPGWDVEVVSTPDDGVRAQGPLATSISRVVRLTRHGVSVDVRGNATRRIEVGGETWVATGLAQAFGPGPLPADAKTYHRYELVRVG